MTSERDCGSQPCDRSPGTALHHGGIGVELHDFTGDCPVGPIASAALQLPLSANAVTTRNEIRMPIFSHCFLFMGKTSLLKMSHPFSSKRYVRSAGRLLKMYRF
jgi:hypothetical protein